MDTGETASFDASRKAAALPPGESLVYFAGDNREHAGDVRRFRTDDCSMDGEFLLLGDDQSTQRFCDRHLKVARNGVVIGAKNVGAGGWFQDHDDRDNMFWVGVIGSPTLDLNPPGNSAPVARDTTFSTEDGTAVNVTLAASDADGDRLVYELISQPEHGYIGHNPPTLEYLPYIGFVGEDSFKFRVSDGNVYSRVATVTIKVVPANNPPEVWGAFPSGVESCIPPTPIDPVMVSIEDGHDFSVWARDQDRDKLTYTWKLDGTTLQVASEEDTLLANLFTYEPDAGHLGPRVLEVVVTDGRGGSDTHQWDLLVTIDPNPPVVTASSPGTPVVVENGKQQRFEVQAEDEDGDILSYYWLLNERLLPCRGTAYTYTANPETWGEYSTYKDIDAYVRDGRGRFVRKHWEVRINFKPSAGDCRYTTEKNLPRSFKLSGSDPDYFPDPLTVEILTEPDHGELSGTLPEVTYTPGANYVGVDSFTYRVFDGNAYSDAATVTITINDTNAAPVIDSAVPASPLSMVAGSTETFEVYASDPDGDPLTCQWKLNGIPIDGATDTSYRYSPRAEDAGRQVRLAVIVSDPRGAAAAHVWYINVTSPSPVIELSAPNMNVQCRPGETPAPRSFEVWNAGPGTLQYTVSVDQPWLSVSPAAGISTGEKDLITVNFAGVDELEPGARYAKITVTAAGAANSPQKLSVYLCVLRPGDLNGDEVVNIDDLVLVTGHFGLSSRDAGWDPRADANGDGVVSIEDLVEVTGNYGSSQD
jgi:hypothetical protein